MKYSNYKKTKNKRDKTFTGTVQGTEKSFAFILPDEDFGHDFFVPKNSLNGALHGDKVLAAIVPDTKDEAKIIKIFERGVKTVIGTIEVSSRGGKVYPDNPKNPLVFIPHPLLNGAKTNDKVICEITSYPRGKAPGGVILEILGESGEFDCEENSIIRSFNLATEFPEEVLSEAKKVCGQKIVPDDRKDLRDKLIFTIDGEDTRDIDDGVSLEKDGKNYILGVHIADVSHYVAPSSALDKEAYARGTSVYFPDRVLPMIPKELSNGICSLNEDEDRYALSCIMTFDENGKRLKYDIFKSIIKSRNKMTYTAIQAMLDGDETAIKKYKHLEVAVKLMGELCKLLEKRRDLRGCINLDVKEAHIYVDENDEIVIPPCEQLLSQRIIEQFMVSANEAVAEFLFKSKVPCLYRVHEKPSEEKAENFISFLRDLGYNARCDSENISPMDFQKILKAVEDKPYAAVINRIMLRTMQKARYFNKNLGHFGLASDCYCHFTSPIRRYPDLFVHRVLKEVLAGNAQYAVKKYGKISAEAGKDCSERERIAAEAERKVDDLYKLAYMSERLGQEFDAIISGVTSSAIFCELENTVEGMITLEDLPPDSYDFLPEKFMLKGIKHTYKIGNAVKVAAIDCDLGRMKVLFTLVK